MVKRQENMNFLKHNLEESEFENNLLKTIRIPKNLLVLTDKLPSANYDKIKTKKNSLAKIIKTDPQVSKNVLNTESNDIKPKKVMLNLTIEPEEAHHKKEKDVPQGEKKKMLKDLLIIKEEKRKNDISETPKRPNSKMILNTEVSKNNDSEKKKNVLMLPAIKNNETKNNNPQNDIK